MTEFGFRASLEDLRIAVIGLGYVGLPLAAEFGKKWPVVGFDVNSRRLDALRAGHDATLEVSDEELSTATHLKFSAEAEDLRDCNFYIVTVPTPIDASKRPNLTPLIRASGTVGSVLKPGDIVVYESTVYPGATEEDCVPILERVSGLAFNKDFFAGYSPERINPGDKEHRLTTIKKVTSGSTPEVATFIDAVYASIIKAGTHLAPSIRVAEAAKVIENTQRDVNIALINELALIFARLGLDTQDVLEASGTKWNFLPFRPGLVGGHCIGVDPYYLTHKAESVGYLPQVILSGRRTNDGMGAHVANQMVRKLAKSGARISDATVLIMGLTFKENCPDIRNTRVIDIFEELQSFGVNVAVCDPWADAEEAKAELGIDLIAPAAGAYDGAVIAVNHAQFVDDPVWDVGRFLKSEDAVIDVKAIYPKSRGFQRL